MAMVDIPGGQLWPHPSSALNVAMGTSSYTLDAVDERAAAIFQAPKAGNIESIGFLTATVATGATITVGLYNLDTNGDADIASGALGTATIVVAGTDDNLWLSVTLSPVVAVTQGQRLAAVVSQPSSSAGNMTVRTTSGSRDPSWASEFPYGALYAGGSWTKSGLQRPFISITYDSSGGKYPCWVRGPYWPGDGSSPTTSVAYNNGSANKEFGMVFIPNRKIRVCGAWAYMLHGTSADHYFKLYSDPTGTPVERASSPLIDGAFSSNTSGGIHLWLFTNSYTLDAGSKYAVTVLPDTANNVTIYKTVANTAADMANIEGGQNMYGGYRATTGATVFTEETTTRYIFGLWIDQEDNGAGGGGGGLALPAVKALC